MINITVEDREGKSTGLEVPLNLNLSLMELLKAADYDIPATCGGIALCATCRVQVIEGIEKLPPPVEQELDMLDTLPDTDKFSRLACQLHINSNMKDMIIRLK